MKVLRVWLDGQSETQRFLVIIAALFSSTQAHHDGMSCRVRTFARSRTLSRCRSAMAFPHATMTLSYSGWTSSCSSRTTIV